MAAISKNEKWPYLRNSLTERNEMWHSDAYWPPKAEWQLTVRTFENPGYQFFSCKISIHPTQESAKNIYFNYK